MEIILIFIMAYLLGSIPFGALFTKLIIKKDIRKKGSKNIGATNVARIAGTNLGILTLICDILKGALPVYIAGYVTSSCFYWQEFSIGLTSLFCFLGHLYPVYYKFKNGGKGVATGAGIFLIISPDIFCIVVIVFSTVFYIFRYVSLASISASIILPFILWQSTHSFILSLCALFISIMILIRHKENIKRLKQGKEIPISLQFSH